MKLRVGNQWHIAFTENCKHGVVHRASKLINWIVQWLSQKCVLYKLSIILAETWIWLIVHIRIRQCTVFVRTFYLLYQYTNTRLQKIDGDLIITCKYTMFHLDAQRINSLRPHCHMIKHHFITGNTTLVILKHLIL